MIVLAHLGHSGSWIEMSLYAALILGPIIMLFVFARFAKEKPPRKEPE